MSLHGSDGEGLYELNVREHANLTSDLRDAVLLGHTSDGVRV